MKKNYSLILLALACFTVTKAQLTLTKAANEPAIGDDVLFHLWDSTASLNNNFGPNTVWDFSTLTMTNTVAKSTYTTVASSPSAAAYTNASFAEFDGVGYNYWKSATSPTAQLELLGISQTSLSINLNANSAIAAIWPIAYGYNKTDGFSGTVQTATANLGGTASGTLKTLASGSGTVLLPGSLSYTNVLQVTATQTINMSLSLGPIPVGTVAILSSNYQYYHGSQKYPILTVSYQTFSGLFSGNSTTIKINNNVIAGIKEGSLSNSDFSIYPNPANDKLTIAFTNQKAENVSVKIFNNLGQLVKSIELGNSTTINNQVDLTGLSSGIYVVKTQVGSASSSKKLIKE